MKLDRKRECAIEPGVTCELEEFGHFQDKSGKIGDVGVMACKKCRHAVSTPAIPDIGALYAGRESQDYQPNTHGLAHWIKETAFRQQARRLLRQVGYMPTRVLDFGCGSGQFTRILGTLVDAGIVIGSDFHDTPPPELTDDHFRSMRELDDLAGSFDMAIAMHVLEHDDDPKALLNKIIALVRNGGTIVIEVPNVECIWARIFGAAWDAWYLPYHRVHFSRKSLRTLIEKSGLKIYSEVDVVVPTMGRSAANIFNRPNSLPWLLLGIILHPFQWIGEKVTRNPSALRVIARKY